MDGKKKFVEALNDILCSMHMLPSSHGVGVYPHAAPAGNHIDYSLVTLPNAEDVSCRDY